MPGTERPCATLHDSLHEFGQERFSESGDIAGMLDDHGSRLAFRDERERSFHSDIRGQDQTPWSPSAIGIKILLGGGIDFSSQ